MLFFIGWGGGREIQCARHEAFLFFCFPFAFGIFNLFYYFTMEVQIKSFFFLKDVGGNVGVLRFFLVF